MQERKSAFDGLDYAQLKQFDVGTRELAIKLFAREMTVQDTMFFLIDVHELNAVSNNKEKWHEKFKEIQEKYFGDNAKYSLNFPGEVEHQVKEEIRSLNRSQVIPEKIDLGVASLIKMSMTDQQLDKKVVMDKIAAVLKSVDNLENAYQDLVSKNNKVVSSDDRENNWSTKYQILDNDHKRFLLEMLLEKSIENKYGHFLEFLTFSYPKVEKSQQANFLCHVVEIAAWNKMPKPEQLNLIQHCNNLIGDDIKTKRDFLSRVERVIGENEVTKSLVSNITRNQVDSLVDILKTYSKFIDDPSEKENFLKLQAGITNDIKAIDLKDASGIQRLEQLTNRVHNKIDSHLKIIVENIIRRFDYSKSDLDKYEKFKNDPRESWNKYEYQKIAAFISLQEKAEQVQKGRADGMTAPEMLKTLQEIQELRNAARSATQNAQKFSPLGKFGLTKKAGAEKKLQDLDVDGVNVEKRSLFSFRKKSN